MIYVLETCMPGTVFIHNGRLWKCISVNGSIVKCRTAMPVGYFITTFTRKDIKAEEQKVEEQKAEKPKQETFTLGNINKIHAIDVRSVKLSKGQVKVEFLNFSHNWIVVEKNFKSITKANEWITEHIIKL